jgi:hypothetical protein
MYVRMLALFKVCHDSIDMMSFMAPQVFHMVYHTVVLSYCGGMAPWVWC